MQPIKINRGDCWNVPFYYRGGRGNNVGLLGEKDHKANFIARDGLVFNKTVDYVLLSTSCTTSLSEKILVGQPLWRAKTLVLILNQFYILLPCHSDNQSDVLLCRMSHVINGFKIWLTQYIVTPTCWLFIDENNSSHFKTNITFRITYRTYLSDNNTWMHESWKWKEAVKVSGLVNITIRSWKKWKVIVCTIIVQPSWMGLLCSSAIPSLHLNPCGWGILHGCQEADLFFFPSFAKLFSMKEGPY